MTNHHQEPGLSDNTTTSNDNSPPGSPGGGHPLLLIHGYPLSREMWTPQLTELSSTMRIIAPDLRGFGESGPPAGTYTIDSYAQDMLATLDSLNITSPVTVCGLSMGGYIALAFSRKYPHRMRSLILMSTRAAPDSPEAQQNRTRQIETVQKEGTAALFSAMLSKLLTPMSLEEKPEIVAEVQRIMGSASGDGVIAALAAMRDRPDSSPYLKEIKVPTMIIHGKDDVLIPPSEAELLAASIPGARLELIPNAAHLPNLEQPESVNAIIRDFAQG